MGAEGSLANPQMQLARYVLRAMPIIIFPFTINFPGVCRSIFLPVQKNKFHSCHRVSGNVFTLSKKNFRFASLLIAMQFYFQGVHYELSGEVWYEKVMSCTVLYVLTWVILCRQSWCTGWAQTLSPWPKSCSWGFLASEISVESLVLSDTTQIPCL